MRFSARARTCRCRSYIQIIPTGTVQIGLKQDELDRCGIFHSLRTARWLRVTPTAGTPCPSSPPWPMAYITELGVADESVETNVDEELAWAYIEGSNIKAGHVVCLQRGGTVSTGTILLCNSGEDGVAYVQAMSRNG
nr:hypothetical protein CFP56_77811 [Quercus suber]